MLSLSLSLSTLPLTHYYRLPMKESQLYVPQQRTQYPLQTRLRGEHGSLLPLQGSELRSVHTVAKSLYLLSYRSLCNNTNYSTCGV